MSQLSLENISVSYGNNPPVIKSLSLDVPKGAFYAMVGPSGAGKTSILRAIGGFVLPSSGKVYLGGEDVTHRRPEQRKLGIVFQDYALFPHMTVGQNVAFGLRMAGASREETKRKVAETLELVGLSGFGKRYPDQLSGGQQQRVALARALVIKPEALLLDEPLSALDRKIRLEMQIELRRIQRETGITAIIVTHDQQEAMSLGDELLVLEGGGFAQSGTPQEVYTAPQTSFVASFLGNVNTLAGRVVDKTRGVLEIDSTQFAGLDCAKIAASGSECEVMFRPESAKILVDEQVPPTGLTFKGRIESAMLNGQTADCQVKTAFGDILVSVLSSDLNDMQVARTGLFHVPAHSVMLFEKEMIQEGSAHVA